MAHARVVRLEVVVRGPELAPRAQILALLLLLVQVGLAGSLAEQVASPLVHRFKYYNLFY